MLCIFVGVVVLGIGDVVGDKIKFFCFWIGFFSFRIIEISEFMKFEDNSKVG